MGVEHRCSLQLRDRRLLFIFIHKKMNCQNWPFLIISRSVLGKEQRAYLYYQKCKWFLQSVFSFLCSSKPVRGSAINTETITNLNSEIPTDYQLSGRLKVENKVLILALINFNGLFKDTYSYIFLRITHLSSLPLQCEGKWMTVITLQIFCLVIKTSS